MTDADKTQQKLIDSIRKSKSTASKPAERSRPAAPSEGAAESSVRPSPMARGGDADPYQSGQRVWPD